MAITTTRPVTLKSGRIVTSGTEVVEWGYKGIPTMCRLECGAIVRIRSAFKPPRFETLERWMIDGVARSVGSKRVEPDGVDDEGSPSWLIALGMI